MRHLHSSRVLGRSPSHRRALYRNMVSALFLTERDIVEGVDPNPPKVAGRITTTIHKAKEIRPMVEKCITIARKGLEAEQAAKKLVTSAERGTDAWKTWRRGADGRKWADAMGPAVTARRRVMQMIRTPEAVDVLFSKIAPRYMDRPGGYTRILRIAKPRLGDNGVQAILELVGKNDRVKTKATKPDFGSDSEAQTESSASE